MDLKDLYISHVKSALYWAQYDRSKLDEKILTQLQGMSGQRTRHFYNNLCSLPDARYLEIGAWKGSSSISALYMNPHCKATIIDNWSEFGGNPQDLIDNLKAYIPHEIDYTYINEDCFTLSVPLNRKYNIYLYDGAHDEEAQRKGITHFYRYLDPISIVVIDDWNHLPTQKGTWEGFEEVNAKILYKKEILLTTDGSHTPFDIAHRDFWNGMAVFVIEKQEYVCRTQKEHPGS